jgi:hypothetical protein
MKCAVIDGPENNKKLPPGSRQSPVKKECSTKYILARFLYCFAVMTRPGNGPDRGFAKFILNDEDRNVASAGKRSDAGQE